jgi:hypothetical protein
MQLRSHGMPGLVFRSQGSQAKLVEWGNLCAALGCKWDESSDQLTQEAAGPQIPSGEEAAVAPPKLVLPPLNKTWMRSVAGCISATAGV